MSTTSSSPATATANAPSVENGWPLPRSARPWGTLPLFSTSVSTAIATWCFLSGGFVSYFLAGGDGTLAVLAGSLIGILFIVLSCLPPSVKYGIDSVVGSRAQFGTRGAGLSLFLVYASVLG